MDLIDGLKSFVATAQTGSFTSAAERLGISNRLTSKYVAELEARLGARLLQRTTRKVGVTAAGEELLARAPAVLDDLEAMLACVREDSRGFSGTLRLSAPVTFGEFYVKDALSRFATAHPDLTIDLRLSDAFDDLASEGIDLAFRIGMSNTTTLKMRRLGEIESVVVAAPDYLEKRPAPLKPADLAEHACIADTNRRNPTRWVFGTDEDAQTVVVPSRFRVNSARVARDLAVAGHGVAFCPRFVLGDAIETGQLVELLTDFPRPVHPVTIVYLEGRTLSRRVRALIDFVRADIRTAGVV